LVEVVADLTASTPPSELPNKAAVDAAVTAHVADVYNTTVQEVSGPVAVGPEAKAEVQGVTVEEALRLLTAVHASAADTAAQERAELEEALADLRALLEQGSPDTGEVVKKWASCGPLLRSLAALR